MLRQDHSENIRQFIISNIENNPHKISKMVSEYFGITRQAVHKHLKKLVAEHVLCEKGQTQNKVYQLCPTVTWKAQYEITSHLSEDVLWRNEIAQRLPIMAKNGFKIWHYGFTEMFNNAIDHSNGSLIQVQIESNAAHTTITIADNGIGIFKKIQEARHLLDERHAILELSKGKLTTDPKRHTGQGIFFSSRMFDAFFILSDRKRFTRISDNDQSPLFEVFFENSEPVIGTKIIMKLSNFTTRTAKEIFDQFTYDKENENFAFNTTEVSVALAQYPNDELISRSQAKRLLIGVDAFKKVIFNFAGVETIGQAFADEIFRVFQLEHPGIILVPKGMNPEVSHMVNRALAENR